MKYNDRPPLTWEKRFFKIPGYEYIGRTRGNPVIEITWHQPYGEISVYIIDSEPNYGEVIGLMVIELWSNANRLMLDLKNMITKEYNKGTDIDDDMIPLLDPEGSITEEDEFYLNIIGYEGVVL